MWVQVNGDAGYRYWLTKGREHSQHHQERDRQKRERKQERKSGASKRGKKRREKKRLSESEREKSSLQNGRAAKQPMQFQHTVGCL